MTRFALLLISLLAATWTACADSSSGACGAAACDTQCTAQGFRGGLCRGADCACVGGSAVACDPLGCDIDCRGGGAV